MPKRRMDEKTASKAARKVARKKSAKKLATNKRRESKQDIAQLVLDISQKVAKADNLDLQLQVIVEEVTRVTDSERGSLFLNDPQTDELYSRIALGGVEREIRFLTIPA